MNVKRSGREMNVENIQENSFKSHCECSFFSVYTCNQLANFDQRCFVSNSPMKGDKPKYANRLQHELPSAF